MADPANFYPITFEYYLGTLGSARLLIYAEFFRQWMSIMAEAQQDPIIFYECTRCYVIIPYLSCYHNCPAVEEEVDQEEEEFQEDLVEWYKEIKKKQKEDPSSVRIVEAPDPKDLVELLPNQPGINYDHPTIYGPDGDGPYHVRSEGEAVPGVTTLLMFKIGPGEFRKEEDVLREHAELAEEYRQQQEEQQQEEEYRQFREIFEEFREPYPC